MHGESSLPKNGLIHLHVCTGCTFVQDEKKEGIYLRGGRVEIDLAESPREGKANGSLLRNLSDWLDFPASRIRIEKRRASRFKTVALSGIPDCDIHLRLKKAVQRFL